MDSSSCICITILKFLFDHLLKNINPWACFGEFHGIINKLQAAQLLKDPRITQKTFSKDFQCLLNRKNFLLFCKDLKILLFCWKVLLYSEKVLVLLVHANYLFCFVSISVLLKSFSRKFFFWLRTQIPGN